MATKTSMLHVRIDDKVKAEASEILAKFGLTISDAVRILLTRVIEEKSLPIGLTVDQEAYDVWFHSKVQEALDSNEPSAPHAEAMEKLRAAVDA